MAEQKPKKKKTAAPAKKAGAAVKKVATRVKKAAAGMMVPKEDLTAGYIATKVAKSGLRGGTLLGLGYIGTRPKVAASKARPYMPLGVGLLGLIGEVMLNDSNPTASALKGVAEGMSTFGILDGFAQLMPNSKADVGLAGYGGEAQVSSDNVDWARMAEEMAMQEQGAVAGLPEGSSNRGDAYGSEGDEEDEVSRLQRGMAAA